jgi:hypothetical protein
MYGVSGWNDPTKLWANLVCFVSVRVVPGSDQDPMCTANRHSNIHVNANDNSNRDTYLNINRNDYAHLYRY